MCEKRRHHPITRFHLKLKAKTGLSNPYRPLWTIYEKCLKSQPCQTRLQTPPLRGHRACLYLGEKKTVNHVCYVWIWTKQNNISKVQSVITKRIVNMLKLQNIEQNFLFCFVKVPLLDDVKVKLDCLVLVIYSALVHINTHSSADQEMTLST